MNGAVPTSPPAVLLGLAPEVATLASVAGLLWALYRYRVGRFPGAFVLPILVALLMTLPLWFLGIVVGGNFGGSFGAAFSERVGLGDSPVVIVIGIFLGVFLVSAIPLLLVVGAAGWAVLRRRSQRP
jgi:hypothetical protein